MFWLDLIEPKLYPNEVKEITKIVQSTNESIEKRGYGWRLHYLHREPTWWDRWRLIVALAAIIYLPAGMFQSIGILGNNIFIEILFAPTYLIFYPPLFFIDLDSYYLGSILLMSWTIMLIGSAFLIDHLMGLQRKSFLKMEIRIFNIEKQESENTQVNQTVVDVVTGNWVKILNEVGFRKNVNDTGSESAEIKLTNIKKKITGKINWNKSNFELTTLLTGSAYNLEYINRQFSNSIFYFIGSGDDTSKILKDKSNIERTDLNSFYKPIINITSDDPTLVPFVDTNWVVDAKKKKIYSYRSDRNRRLVSLLFPIVMILFVFLVMIPQLESGLRQSLLYMFLVYIFTILFFLIIFQSRLLVPKKFNVIQIIYDAKKLVEIETLYVFMVLKQILSEYHEMKYIGLRSHSGFNDIYIKWNEFKPKSLEKNSLPEGIYPFDNDGSIRIKIFVPTHMYDEIFQDIVSKVMSFKEIRSPPELFLDLFPNEDPNSGIIEYESEIPREIDIFKTELSRTDFSKYKFRIFFGIILCILFMASLSIGFSYEPTTENLDSYLTHDSGLSDVPQMYKNMQSQGTWVILQLVFRNQTGNTIHQLFEISIGDGVIEDTDYRHRRNSGVVKREFQYYLKSNDELIIRIESANQNQILVYQPPFPVQTLFNSPALLLILFGSLGIVTISEPFKFRKYRVSDPLLRRYYSLGDETIDEEYQKLISQQTVSIQPMFIWQTLFILGLMLSFTFLDMMGVELIHEIRDLHFVPETILVLIYIFTAQIGLLYRFFMYNNTDMWHRIAFAWFLVVSLVLAYFWIFEGAIEYYEWLWSTRG